MALSQIVQNLLKLNEKPAAINLVEAFSRHAFKFEQCDEIAKCFFILKKYKEAIPFAEKTLTQEISNEQKYNARVNLVNVYAHAYEPEKALEQIEILEKINPEDNDVQLKKSYALFLLGRREEAEKILHIQLNNSKNDEKTKNDINFNLGTYELYRDNFHEGLYRFLIHGRKLNLWQKPKLPFTEWDQIVRPNHLIVIRQEAGIGDELINVRFMTEFEKRGMIPIWYTDRIEMGNLFNRNGFTAVSSIDEIKQYWEKHKGNIYWCHSMDVPLLLKLNYDDLWKGPYLKSDSAIDSAIKKNNRLKIGLRWQGNPDYDNDLHRSVPLNELFDAVKHVDADFYSLQRDTGAEDVYDFPEIVPLHKTSLKTIEETLAVINDLDIVVTTCTSIAHASAAMGKKTYVLSPMSSYYIWCFSDKHPRSPWYGNNVKLLRQKRPRYWDEPLKELKDNLKFYESNNN